jgi:beta-phosphoglucomutase-like phosphatase (HAD superfamily)
LGLASAALFPDVESSNGILTVFVLEYFPTGLKGLMLVGIMAAVMSSADICILTASANLTRDVYQRYFNPQINKGSMLRLGMWSSVVAGLLATFMAWKMQDIIDILLLGFTINSAALFVPTIAALMLKKTDSAAAFWSIALSLVTGILWKIAASYGAGGVFKEDVFLAMGGRPTHDIVVELNDEYDLHLDPDAVAIAKREAFLKRLKSVTLIDEISAFAESLRGKFPTAVASGGSRMVVEKTLRVVGVSDWFDEVVTADDVPEGKPAPDVFLYAAELLGVKPADCLVLEDAPAGILAAQLAGMQVVAVPSPLISSI